MGLIMNKILNINKPLGLTSYDVIRILKNKYPGEKIGHAGTLDPLAEGVLICLVGSESTKRQNEFLNVKKEYEFEVLFGFKTDTYDILGLIEEMKEYNADEIKTEIGKLLSNYIGDIKQPVPPFSAVKIKGRPLYRWYLSGEIENVDIPVKEIFIEKIEIISRRIIDTDELKNEVYELLNSVSSGFRQNQVKESWEHCIKLNKRYLLVKFQAQVSKGTYVRALANQMGKDLGIGACTTTIKRTQVGNFNIKDSIDINDA
jgi:tRNA pseudouridine55 synthase